MVRYYFDIVEGADRTEDEVGREFPDRSAARDEAARILVDLARDAVGLTEHARLEVRVSNDADQANFVATLCFDLQDGLSARGDRG